MIDRRGRARCLERIFQIMFMTTGFFITSVQSGISAQVSLNCGGQGGFREYRGDTPPPGASFSDSVIVVENGLSSKRPSSGRRFLPPRAACGRIINSPTDRQHKEGEQHSLAGRRRSLYNSLVCAKSASLFLEIAVRAALSLRPPHSDA